MQTRCPFKDANSGLGKIVIPLFPRTLNLLFCDLLISSNSQEHLWVILSFLLVRRGSIEIVYSSALHFTVVVSSASHKDESTISSLEGTKKHGFVLFFLVVQNNFYTLIICLLNNL